MSGKAQNFSIFLLTIFVFYAQQSFAQVIHLSSPTILGNLKLPAKEMKSIQSAVKKAMNSTVDSEFQCGKVRLDCVARAAREWTYQGNTFREIVVNIHTIGHASFTVEKPKGKAWPSIAIK
jgi:hypothetical protein